MTALVAPYNVSIVWKNPLDKGHDRSMNMIRNLTAPYDYVFHIEDDWEFIRTRNFIADSIAILEENPRLGQVLINQNYAEIETELEAVAVPTR